VYVVRITPADVGARVVIRRRIAGPPTLSDVLGILESWDDDVLAVRTASGELVRVPRDDIVAARPVPPRAARTGPSATARHDPVQDGTDGHPPANSIMIGPR
jgi:hypothetical protein